MMSAIADIKPFEITHEMQLIMRIIRHGYAYALESVPQEDEHLIEKYKDKTEAELLQAKKELKSLIG